MLDVDQGALGDGDDAQPDSQLHVLAHGASQRRHLAAVGHGGVDDLLHPVHVAGEAGHDDALVGLGGEDPAEGDADRGLGFGEAGLLGVGGVRQQQPDALGLGQLPHAGEVGAATVDRLQVDFEVTRVEDDALGRVEGDGERIGHRVGDRDELHVARPDAAALAVAHGDELRAVAEAGLLHPVPGQADRELGPVDGHLQIAQEIRQSPGVVLVTVGQDDAVDPVGPLPEVGELGQDQVHAGHVGVGEHDPAVEDDDAAVDLDAGAVAADLPEPSEKDDTDGRRLGA